MTAVVLNWNGAAHTVNCLSSLAGSSYPELVTVVVDNGSGDDSVQRIRSSHPGTAVIETGKNLGYAGGNNVGIRHALGHGAEYVWILNNDTVVRPDCLQRLVEAAESDPAIGMAGAKICYLHAPKTIWYAGGKVDLRSGLTGHVGKDEPDLGGGSAAETEFITGCSVLVKRRTIEEIGLMDESYFLYFEDVDWSLRARRAGWKLWFEPRAELYHAEGAQTQGRYSERFIYYTLRNRLYFMKRFAPGNMPACHLTQLKAALYFAKGAAKAGWRQGARVLRVALQAYRDFYLRRQMGCKEP